MLKFSRNGNVVAVSTPDGITPVSQDPTGHEIASWWQSGAPTRKSMVDDEGVVDFAGRRMPEEDGFWMAATGEAARMGVDVEGITADEAFRILAKPREQAPVFDFEDASAAHVESDGSMEIPWWMADSLGLEKGEGHKYVKRVPRPGGGYRYFYNVAGVGSTQHFEQGAKFQVHGKASAAHLAGGKGHIEIIGKTEGGNLKIRHDETGEEAVISPAVLSAMLHHEHAAALDAHKAKLGADIQAAEKHGTPKQVAKLKAEAAKHEHTAELAKPAMSWTSDADGVLTTTHAGNKYDYDPDSGGGVVYWHGPHGGGMVVKEGVATKSAAEAAITSHAATEEAKEYAKPKPAPVPLKAPSPKDRLAMIIDLASKVDPENEHHMANMVVGIKAAVSEFAPLASKKKLNPAVNKLIHTMNSANGPQEKLAAIGSLASFMALHTDSAPAPSAGVPATQKPAAPPGAATMLADAAKAKAETPPAKDAPLKEHHAWQAALPEGTVINLAGAGLGIQHGKFKKTGGKWKAVGASGSLIGPAITGYELSQSMPGRVTVAQGVAKGKRPGAALASYQKELEGAQDEHASAPTDETAARLDVAHAAHQAATKASVKHTKAAGDAVQAEAAAAMEDDDADGDGEDDGEQVQQAQPRRPAKLDSAPLAPGVSASGHDEDFPQRGAVRPATDSGAKQDEVEKLRHQAEDLATKLAGMVHQVGPETTPLFNALKGQLRQAHTDPHPDHIRALVGQVKAFLVFMDAFSRAKVKSPGKAVKKSMEAYLAVALARAGRERSNLDDQPLTKSAGILRDPLDALAIMAVDDLDVFTAAAFARTVSEDTRKGMRPFSFDELRAHAAAAVPLEPPSFPNRQEHPFVGVIRLPGGVVVDVENERGGTRSGTGADGKEWSVTMPDHYGEIRGTKGNDGEPMDIFVGDHLHAPYVYVVALQNESGAHDEDKIFYGYRTRGEVDAVYAAAYPRRKDLKMAVRKLTQAEFLSIVHGDEDRQRRVDAGQQLAKSLRAVARQLNPEGVAEEESDLLDRLRGAPLAKGSAGPFIGPKGGKWADAAHTIPWSEPKSAPKAEPPRAVTFTDALKHPQGKEIIEKIEDYQASTDGERRFASEIADGWAELKKVTGYDHLAGETPMPRTQKSMPNDVAGFARHMRLTTEGDAGRGFARALGGIPQQTANVIDPRRG